MKKLVFLLCAFTSSLTITAQSSEKARVIVLTDIEADPDDTQSLVRLLLYANEIDIKGLIATTSCWLQHSIHPESIEQVIDAYDKVYANLSKHDSSYPPAEELKPLIKKGQSGYGLQATGKKQQTEGSNWIIKNLEQNDDRPLWISIWGGANTLAQALKDLKATKSKAELQKLISKLRVYTISDQDDSGLWIRNNFPELFYIVSPGDDYGVATWTGINTVVQGIDNRTISNEWLSSNIQQNHGVLGAMYPDVAWGMEGDTPAFLGLIPNGLNHSEKPNWGGWGGRYELYQPDHSNRKDGSSIVQIAPETRPIWTNANDTYTPYVQSSFGRYYKRDTTTFKGDKVTLWRWRDHIQNDFAARMDWTINEYTAANHPPVPVLSHASELSVTSGEGVSLRATNTYDPDGDHFSFLWYQYPEAGTYQGAISLGAENVHKAFFIAPDVAKTETVHIILEVTDKGTPPLTRYERVVVTIAPSKQR